MWPSFETASLVQARTLMQIVASEVSGLLLTGAIRDRARGALLGLAVGDALGTTLEFETRDRNPLHTEMVGGGPFGLASGEWTDDTAMALALADSLIACRGFDARDLMSRFVGWWRNGAYSCTATCFDIGITTREALARYERTGEIFAGSTTPQTAGNGSLMRLAPVALFALNNPGLADQIARGQSRTTHGAPEAVDACAYFIQLLRLAILGEKNPLCARLVIDRDTDGLRPRRFIEGTDGNICRRTWTGEPAVEAIAAGAWRAKSRAEVRSTGCVIDTLEAALWSVVSTNSFEEALILAVNLAHDADTVGAVTGQLAGAIYGASAIPTRWLAPLAWRERIITVADGLVDRIGRPLGS